MRKGILAAAVLLIAAGAFWFLTVPSPRATTTAVSSPPVSSPSGMPVPAPAAMRTPIPYHDAKPALDAHSGDLPEGLRSKTAAELESAWPEWVTRRDGEIRARLAQGDEDSVVNLWLYGTTFTTLPRATEQHMASFKTRDAAEDLLLRRLDDLVEGLAAPTNDDRLQFARQLLDRQGISLSTEDGKQQARVYLVKIRERVIAELARYRRAAESARKPGDRSSALTAYATMYRDRGLSSDTRLTADFALDKALDAIAAKGALAPHSVRRIAIVGPGLDFTDKAEGYDFYPLQTIQPFAVMDSLTRLGLLSPDDVRMTTLDLSPRVNTHLANARQRAMRGEPYVLQLPLAKDDPKHQWHPDLVAYWKTFGGTIGEETAPTPPPAVAGNVQVRAVRVRSALVLSIFPRDLDIIVQRLEPLADTERFDLIVATNILVYYDAFEQGLALANIAKMLRPGGYFVTNYAVSPLPPLEPSASIVTSVFFDRQGNGDTIFCYQKR